MPYISQEKRLKFDSVLIELNNVVFENKGELEYLIFAILIRYMKYRKKCYSELHDTTYACQHVADEFRRRFLDKREDTALETNGEIF
jgi:hypothetical protein